MHDVVEDRRGDFELDHGLVGPVPEPVPLGLRLGDVQLADQLAELAEHDRIEVVVVARYHRLLVW